MPPRIADMYRHLCDDATPTPARLKEGATLWQQLCGALQLQVTAKIDFYTFVNQIKQVVMACAVPQLQKVWTDTFEAYRANFLVTSNLLDATGILSQYATNGLSTMVQLINGWLDGVQVGEAVFQKVQQCANMCVRACV